MRDQLKISGNVIITAWCLRTGDRLIDERRGNLVVVGGRNVVRDLLNTGSGAFPTHLAVGTGSTAVSSVDTALGTEVFRAAITQRITSSAQLRLKYYLSSLSANGNTLRECGLFTAASGPILFARALNTAIVKTSSIAVTYDWTINIGAS